MNLLEFDDHPSQMSTLSNENQNNSSGGVNLLEDLFSVPVIIPQMKHFTPIILSTEEFGQHWTNAAQVE